MVKVVLISVFLLVFCGVHYCFANSLENFSLNPAQEGDFLRKEANYSKNYGIKMFKCDTKSLLKNKKESCKTKLQNLLSENRSLYKQSMRLYNNVNGDQIKLIEEEKEIINSLKLFGIKESIKNIPPNKSIFTNTTIVIAGILILLGCIILIILRSLIKAGKKIIEGI